jgi:hypothetical protein
VPRGRVTRLQPSERGTVVRLLWCMLAVFFLRRLEEGGFDSVEGGGGGLDEDILRMGLWVLYDGGRGQSFRRQWTRLKGTGRCRLDFGYCGIGEGSCRSLAEKVVS